MTGHDPVDHDQLLDDQALHDLDQTAVLLTITDQFLRTSRPVVIDELRDWLEDRHPTINFGWLIDMSPSKPPDDVTRPPRKPHCEGIRRSQPTRDGTD